MATENAQKRGRQEPKSASENTTIVSRRRHGRAPLELPDPLGAVLEDYIHALASAPLAAQTRRTYTSKVRQYGVPTTSLQNPTLSVSRRSR
ncbi:MAG: hypothetical protein ACLP22_00380 [Solirubrobacteraceae bacterium]